MKDGPYLELILGSKNILLCSGGPGSVRLGHGLEMEQFEWFRFSVPAVPLQKGFFCMSVQFNRKGRFRFRFRFLENGSGGSSSAFGFGKTVPTVPVSGSGSVPEPPCLFLLQDKLQESVSN